MVALLPSLLWRTKHRVPNLDDIRHSCNFLHDFGLREPFSTRKGLLGRMVRSILSRSNWIGSLLTMPWKITFLS